jgi:hypothetical protein
MRKRYRLDELYRVRKAVRDLFTYSLCMAGVREGSFLSGRQTGERGAAEVERGVSKNRASISTNL